MSESAQDLTPYGSTDHPVLLFNFQSLDLLLELSLLLLRGRQFPFKLIFQLLRRRLEFVYMNQPSASDSTEWSTQQLAPSSALVSSKASMIRLYFSL